MALIINKNDQNISAPYFYETVIPSCQDSFMNCKFKEQNLFEI